MVPAKALTARDWTVADAYVETVRVGPDDSVELTRPFSVRLAPAEWTRLG